MSLDSKCFVFCFFFLLLSTLQARGRTRYLQKCLGRGRRVPNMCGLTLEPPSPPFPLSSLKETERTHPPFWNWGKCSGHVTLYNTDWTQIFRLHSDTVIYLELVTEVWALRNGQPIPTSTEPKVLLALWKLGQVLRAAWEHGFRRQGQWKGYRGTFNPYLKKPLCPAWI